MGAQFERNEVAKTYLAVVRGWPPESGTITHPLSRTHDEYGHALAAAEPQSGAHRLPPAGDRRAGLAPSTATRRRAMRWWRWRRTPAAGTSCAGT